MKTSAILVSVVFAVLTTVQAANVNISEIVDLKLELANKLALASNRTVVDYGSGFLSMVNFEGAVGIGLDSLIRTGDCQMRFDGEKITYVYRIGQKILATFFRKLTYKDVSGSGYYKVLNNSIEFSYSVLYSGAACNVQLESLSLSMGGVEAYIQDKSWNSRDDAEFNTLIQQQVVPAFNKKLKAKSTSIQDALGTVFCQKSPSGDQHMTAGVDVLRTFLFE